MKPPTREWVKKAEDDFKVASQILRRRKDIVPDAACFSPSNVWKNISRRD